MTYPDFIIHYGNDKRFRLFKNELNKETLLELIKAIVQSDTEKIVLDTKYVNFENRAYYGTDFIFKEVG